MMKKAGRATLPKQRLALETLRVLTTTDLRIALGGAVAWTQTNCGCPPKEPPDPG